MKIRKRYIRISWIKMCRSKKDGGIGFMDFDNFNQVLLVKQAWRLLSEPNSLICRIYKSRYYAKKNFMEAGSSYRPSYVWLSILFGRELLSKRFDEIYREWRGHKCVV